MQETTMAIDPVCGMTVDPRTSQLWVDHDDKRYWFCSRGCKLDFEEDPEKYLDADYKPMEM